MNISKLQMIKIVINTWTCILQTLNINRVQVTLKNSKPVKNSFK